MAQVLKEEVRHSILNAARRSFIEYGYSNSTVRQIAKGAQITVGNVYRYYSGKEDIYQAIIADVVAELDQVLKIKSQGQISLFSQPLKGKLMCEQYAERIVDGIFELIPKLLSSHRQEVSILLQTANQSNPLSEQFNLAQWVAEHFDSMKRYHGIGKYLAISLLSGIEAVVMSDLDHQTASLTIEQLIRTVLA